MAAPKTKNQEIVAAILGSPPYDTDLLFCQDWDQFYLYDAGYYRQLTVNDVDKMVWEYIRGHFPEMNITAPLVHDIIKQMKWAVTRKVAVMHTPYIAFLDKLYNMDTFAFEDFHRDRIAVHRIPFKAEETGTGTPHFFRYLESTLVKDDNTPDTELINLVQEMFGYYLLNNLKAEAVFFLVGQGANGKSVMLRLLIALIGKQYTSSFSIEALTTNKFAVANLIGKKINICAEEESKYLRMDKFKALVSGEYMQGERKFGESFQFAPQTKYLFATNKMPTFDGINHGLRRRMKIIPFKRIFKQVEQNKHLSEDLATELPGIIWWAIAGARGLVQKNYEFLAAKSASEKLEEFEELSSSAIMFFRETYERSDEGFVTNADLYKEYVTWCSDNGKHPMSSTVFHRELVDNLQVESKVEWIQGKSVRGKKVKPIGAPEAPDVAYVEKLLGLRP